MFDALITSRTKSFPVDFFAAFLIASTKQAIEKIQNK